MAELSPAGLSRHASVSSLPAATTTGMPALTTAATARSKVVLSGPPALMLTTLGPAGRWSTTYCRALMTSLS